MKKILITGINSDIAKAFVDKIYDEKKYEIEGTYRRVNRNVEILASKKINMSKVDFSDDESIDQWLNSIDVKEIDMIYFIHGDLKPIGKLGDVQFEQWREAQQVNFLSIVKVLNFCLGSLKKGCKILTLAGGGVNGAPVNFSAYTSSKVALVKLTELCAAEYPDLLFFCLGPGWVNTPIHQQTLESGAMAGDAYNETVKRLQNNDFIDMERVTNALNFFLDDANQVFSGRNYSVASGELQHTNLNSLLESDDNIFKLRRCNK